MPPISPASESAENAASPGAGSGRIRVLGADLVNQIAAGEVVERPASVVKELIENSIDAGASVIDIVLESGGKKLIEVRDNGIGMSESDALLSVRRHATSKIRSFEDLVSVATLGFRGEALPSISSVSRFRLTTWDGTSPHGSEIDLDLTAEPRVRPAASEQGTTVRVADLFENVPARRKFLKSVDAEFRAVVAIVASYALPAPGRSIRLTHNGRLVLDLPAVPSLRERVIQIIGRDAESGLEPISSEIEDCRAHGFVTRGIRYGSRRNQFFFVNGRVVRDRVITHAVNRAADAFDFEGHPAVILFLELPAAGVDVNVHPAKTEVRFRDSGVIHVLVEHGVKRALGGPETGAKLLPDAPSHVAESPVAAGHADGQQQGLGSFALEGPGPERQHVAHEVTPLFRKESLVQPPVESAAEAFSPAWREAPLGDLRGKVIGQYRLSYILIDDPSGLRIVDQHVAHERVLYDQLISKSSSVSAQRLLEPFLYETGAAEAAQLESQMEELREAGFEIEKFSRNSFAVSAVPAILQREGLAGLLGKLVDRSFEERTSHLTRLREKIIASVACQAAIKVHRPLGGSEMSRLVAQLLESSNPYACPHGRPIIVDIRHLDVERHFHRK